MLYPDEHEHNADWTKMRLDLPWSEVGTRDELMALLDERGLTLEHFYRMPLYALSKEHWDKLLSEEDDHA
jgi:hypothetical protein